MRKFVAPLGGGVLVALAVVSWFFVRRPPPPLSAGQPQGFSALQILADRAARQALPEAGAAQQQVELRVPKEKIESEINRVKALASDFGGSAVASPFGSGGADLLVQLPAERCAAFLAAVTDPGKPCQPMPASTNTDTVFVEVILAEPPGPVL